MLQILSSEKFTRRSSCIRATPKKSSAGLRWEPANDPNFSQPLRKCKLPISPLLECRFSWPKMPFRILHQARRTPKIPFRPLQTDFLAPKSCSWKILSKSHNINKLGENKRAESCGAFFGRRRARISVSFLSNPEKSPHASHSLSFLYVFVWKYTKQNIYKSPILIFRFLNSYINSPLVYFYKAHK